MSTTPHDALFKAVFTQIEHAAGMFRAALPPEMLARLDLAALTLQPGSFVDRKLSARHTDVLFSAPLSGRPAFLYLLFEHQSTVDPLMVFRLLEYMVRIWRRYLADHPDARELPAIIPLVLHHGATGWRAAVAFEDLLALDAETLGAVADYVPRFRFVLDDVGREPDAILKSRSMTALGRLVLWCLKHARRPQEILAGLPGWLDLVREVRRSPNGAAALELIWRYIFAISEPMQPDDLIDRLLVAAGEEGAEEIVTVADMLREEGRLEGERKGLLEGERKGLLEGERKGRCSGLLKMLGVRFGPLPEAVVARVQAADLPRLESWTERVLTAPTLNDVFA